MRGKWMKSDNSEYTQVASIPKLKHAFIHHVRNNNNNISKDCLRGGIFLFFYVSNIAEVPLQLGLWLCTCWNQFHEWIVLHIMQPSMFVLLMDNGETCFIFS